ncbi:MAG: hypothetical protein E6920_20715 [Clostridium sp.]|uniref:hypothetical protein n=1 Tax=Paraclostridium sordellii TaxID=1505 RepID=UPI0005E436D9|nr:hypothetical protein [Paeniclostridium sordellii]MDU1404313.1 hypothetical protein [Clostridium sp.]CEP43735.1 Uncharacterised protein [[Clostridium] sordellii] [Paeniclostridium sordellii]CEP44038.1 Uncharacterised protein [[Clostridium] sordellii] [Paeniclostridium sordellii]CEP50469.1 Uncharacterised protein [[Clostridium] sordellii] [Paeniclostridium sordellii]CEP50473.1 Uncharacterised protein [[Clostridium] sordellii] [Paeniclostridium sordellii]
MKFTKFGNWNLNISESENKQVNILKDEQRLILLDGENYYLLYAQLEEGSIVFQNVDNDVLIKMNLDENKIEISFKKEEL